jgi:polyvinyl alcohol dehydrogenase (cytochrome)
LTTSAVVGAWLALSAATPSSAVAANAGAAADATATAAAPAAPAAPAAGGTGARLYAERCASCHEGGVARVPNHSLLELLTPGAIYGALTNGPMQAQAQGLDAPERTAIAEFLSGHTLEATPAAAPRQCPPNADWFDYRRAPLGRGWGIDPRNTRMVPADRAALSRNDVAQLGLEWAFAYPGMIRASSQPLIAGGALFVGSQDGTAYALDARTGCVRWSYHGGGEIRGAFVIAPWQKRPAAAPTLYFGDNFGYVHALDAVTGALRWKLRVDDHAAARVYGTPVLASYRGTTRLYVPVASFEEVAASTADYPCCTFRGSIVALDPATGRQLWKTYTVTEPAVMQGHTSLGRPRYGPSGAGVWSSPTVDLQRGALYFTTGNNYSGPADGNSNAIFAIDLQTGAVRWRHQVLAGDASNMSCYAPVPGSRFSLGNDVNCPVGFGPDLDFTAPPVLVRGRHGRDVLVAGQKSGDFFGVDPDGQGRLVWSTRLSRGDARTAGGFQFGMAVERERVFVPILDFPMSYVDAQAASRLAGTVSRDGLYALDADTGHLVWSAPASSYCRKASCPGNQAAALAIPGVVFAGATDGMIRAFDSHTGRPFWEYDTTAPVVTLNGERAHGGTIAGSAVMVADGMLYVNSGYGGITGAPGNVLLAFAVHHDRKRAARQQPARLP